MISCVKSVLQIFLGRLGGRKGLRKFVCLIDLGIHERVHSQGCQKISFLNIFLEIYINFRIKKKAFSLKACYKCKFLGGPKMAEK